MATRTMGSHNANSLTHALQRMRHHASLFMFLCTASQAFGAASPSLEIQGQRYASVCQESQTANLKKMFLGAHAPNATQAWRIIDMLLCAPKSHANRATVRKWIKGRVKRIVDSTGDESEQKWERASQELASQLMAGGQAWNANIEVEAQTIALQYYPNEACIRTVNLEYVGTQWVLHEFGDACD